MEPTSATAVPEPTDDKRLIAPRVSSGEKERGPIRALLQQLLREHTEPGQMGIAVAVGIMVGATPFYGGHILMCIIVAVVFRLNKLTVLLANNISNPILAPILLTVEILVGQYVLHGEFVWLTRERLAEEGLQAIATHFFVSAMVGSVVVGLVIGIPAGLATTCWLRSVARRAGPETDTSEANRRRRDGLLFARAVDAVAVAFRQGAREQGWRRWRGLALSHYIRTKMGNDPMYRDVVSRLPEHGALIEVGRGGSALPLLLSTLYPWRSSPLVTVLADEQASLATATRANLEAIHVQVVRDHQAAWEASDVTAVCLLDVLSSVSPEDQIQLVSQSLRMLKPGGLLIIRDTPTLSAVARMFVRLDQMMGRMTGLLGSSDVYPVDGLKLMTQLTNHGLEVEEFPMPQGLIDSRLWCGRVQ